MLIRCAWCKRTLGDKPPYGGKYDRDVTDGICDDCLNRYFPNIANEVAKLSITEQYRYPDYKMRDG